MPSRSERPVVFVTGGSRGIGRAICVQAAQAGWDVAFTWRSDRESALATIAAIEEAGGAGAAFQCDISSQELVRQAFAAAWDRFRRLDALVNNAATMPHGRPVEEIDEPLLLDGFRANVFGLFHATGEAVKHMSTRRGHAGGCIVNLTSTAARNGGGMPNGSVYAATKGAVDSFTLAMARELAPQGIRVNAVRPGIIATDIHESYADREQLEAAAPLVPLQRIGTAAEVAAAVVFLLAPGASYIHGATVDVTGGR